MRPRRFLLCFPQGAVGLGAAAVPFPAQDAPHALLGNQFAFVGGFQSHVVALVFADFAVQLDNRRHFHRAGPTGEQGGPAVFRQDFLLKTEPPFHFSAGFVRLALHVQTALGRQLHLCLLHAAVCAFRAADGLVIFLLLAGGGIGRGIAGSFRIFGGILKFQAGSPGLWVAAGF